MILKAMIESRLQKLVVKQQTSTDATCRCKDALGQKLGGVDMRHIVATDLTATVGSRIKHTDRIGENFE